MQQRIQPPFPQRIAVVMHPDGEVIPFTVANGSSDAVPQGNLEMVLLGHGVDEAAVHSPAAPGALLLPANRVLELLAPGVARRHPTSPEEIANDYFNAVAPYAADPEGFQLALQALPATAGVERRLLGLAVARATAQNLGRRSAKLPPVRPTELPRGPLHTPDWRSKDVHRLLEECLEHLGRWRAAVDRRDLEPRQGQVDMAHAVLDTLLQTGTLMVEAGTGIGKTLAYALPAILVAALQQKRIAISTQTRNLQQQLVEHDLPELWESLGLADLQRQEGERGLCFAKLLGRQNYYCRSALHRWVRRQIEEGGSLVASQVVLATLRSQDGVLEDSLPDLDPTLWQQICSRREACLGRECRSAPGCPLHIAREAARSADVVVVNHALLLADARSGKRVLGGWDALIVDECHTLKRVATEAYGVRLGAAQVEAWAAPLARLEAEARVLDELARGGEFSGWRQRFEALTPLLAETRRRLLERLALLDERLPQSSRSPARQRYRDGDEVFGRVRAEFEEMQAELSRATREVLALREDFPSEAIADLPGAGEASEILELLVELHLETSAALEFLMRGNDEDWAFYLDFGAESRALLEIVALPLDVSRYLRDVLEEQERAIVYTSATLYVGDDASYFRQGVGLASDTSQLRVESPFDYDEQCLIAHTASFGHYTDPDFIPQVAEMLVELRQRCARRTLVLLTAHRSLRFLCEELLQRLGEDVPVLAQGISGSRTQLARRFAATPGAILLGTDSFWEGVDFPGEALEILLITKLPFAAPNDPVVSARSERLRSHGEDPFTEFILPEAVLRFRQGFGRLIRSRVDRGAAILLDARLEGRDYAESFFEVLPTRTQHYDRPAELIERVIGWLS